MCGGVIVHWKTVPGSRHLGEVMKVGTEERVVSFKYYKNPVLPASKDGITKLYEWGNRDDTSSKLPKTGWCRIESVEAGKWKWLQPESIEIPVIGGIEKGKWVSFDSPLQGLIVLDEKKKPHVYMLTQQASDEYLDYTKHARMPVFSGTWKPMKAPQPM